MTWKLDFNAPIILSFALICVTVQAINEYSHDSLEHLFSIGGHFNYKVALEYPRLFLHPIGHAGWDHLFNNMLFILLLGPITEEKYGSQRLLFMILITALLTAVLNILFFKTGLHGASGIVFMLIMLVSFANFRNGKIPITFILILVLFVGKEVIESIKDDNISQFAHIIGGLCGSFFGFTKGLKG